MTEIELLRDLEKAAHGIHRTSMPVAYDVLYSALNDIKNYRAQPQEAEGETVEVRAVVTMTPDGKKWTIMGSEAWSDDDAEMMIRNYDPRDERRVAIITARVPLTVVPTIPAKVAT